MKNIALRGKKKEKQADLGSFIRILSRRQTYASSRYVLLRIEEFCFHVHLTFPPRNEVINYLGKLNMKYTFSLGFGPRRVRVNFGLHLPKVAGKLCRENEYQRILAW